MMKLNIACHTFKFDGWLNCDLDPEVNPDQIVDFTKKFPWKDNSIDEIYCGHFLEHLDGSEVDFFLSECKRVLKKDGVAAFIIPDWKKSLDWLITGMMTREWFDMIIDWSDQYGGHKQVFDMEKLIKTVSPYFSIVKEMPCSEIWVCDVEYQSAVKCLK